MASKIPAKQAMNSRNSLLKNIDEINIPSPVNMGEGMFFEAVK
jgi:hypothetical protein